jgi:hypothetical protein
MHMWIVLATLHLTCGKPRITLCPQLIQNLRARLLCSIRVLIEGVDRLKESARLLMALSSCVLPVARSSEANFLKSVSGHFCTSVSWGSSACRVEHFHLCDQCRYEITAMATISKKLSMSLATAHLAPFQSPEQQEYGCHQQAAIPPCTLSASVQ